MAKISKIPLSWEIVKFNKRRLLLSLCGIAFSVIAMFLEMGFYNGFNDSQMNLVPLLNADLVMMHKNKIHMMKTSEMTKAILYQPLAVEEVREVIPIFKCTVRFRNPQTEMIYKIGLISFPAGTYPFKIPELHRYQDALKTKDTVLYDSSSRAIYGNIRKDMEIELSGRKVTVGGLIKLGPNFTENGWVITGDMNWASFGQRSDEIAFGVIRAAPGTDIKALKKKISAIIPDYAIVLTVEEIKERDTRFWTTATPFGIVFGTGLIIGFIIGVMICYQILYNEITDNMPQYATLKALGFSRIYIVGIVIKIALVISVLGFLPGLLGGWVLYVVIEYFTRINMFLTTGRILLICILTVLMCAFSGALAVRKVLTADPAALF